MRFLKIFAAGCAVAISPAVAKVPHSALSWGKANVPIDAYRRDAIECADASRHVTAVIKPTTLRQLDGLSAAQLLDTVMQIGVSNPANVVSAITKFGSADDIARRTNTFGAKYVAMVAFDVRDQLQAAIDACLIARGYTRIQLTAPQLQGLHKLKPRSPERTAYLHAIDSDATVIARQRVGTAL